MTEALLLATALLSTQQFHYGQFVEGVETTVFADGSVMLSDSTPDAEHVADLSAGLPVVILESGRDWCLVETGSGFCRIAITGATGWVEAEDLAPVSLVTSCGLFQLGITGFDESGYPAGEARLYRDDGVVLSCPVGLRHFSEDGRVYYCVEASEVSAEGLSGAGTAVILSFIYEACGYLNSDMLLVATADELVPGPEAESASEAGIFHHISSLVLPVELGEDDVVEVSTRHTEWIEDGDSLYVSLDETSSVRYVWNGRFFDLEP